MLRWILTVEGALVVPPLEVPIEWKLSIAETVGLLMVNNWKKYFNTNKSLFASSLIRTPNTNKGRKDKKTFWYKSY